MKKHLPEKEVQEKATQYLKKKKKSQLFVFVT